MWPALVLSILSASPSCDCSTNSAAWATGGISGTAHAAQSPNFDVHCHPGCCDARQLAQTCEKWRDYLRDKWLAQPRQQQPAERWSPRCVIVAHCRRETYLAAVGPGGNRSFGSTWIDTRGKRISARRVDLFMDREGRLSALGHELTHVVMADAFPGEQPPSWANEGMALLADSAKKREDHAQDVTAAYRNQTAFHCAELLVMDGYPSSDRIPAFYGQSLALVELLAETGEPCEFVSFLQTAKEQGYDRALRDVYGISGASELQQLCLARRSPGTLRANVAHVSPAFANDVQGLPAGR